MSLSKDLSSKRILSIPSTELKIVMLRLRKWVFRIQRDTVMRGASLLTLGQCSLVISGYVVNVMLARILGVESYGTYGLLMSILVWIEMILASGTGTALEKSVATQPGRAKDLWRQALRLQGAISIALFSLTIILAPFVSILLKDSQLTFFIRFAALDLLFFGFFRLGRGLDTGLQQFERVAVIVGVYAFLKTAAIPLLTLSPLGLMGAFAGNTLASVGAVVVVFAFASHVAESSPAEHPNDLNNNFLAVIPLSVFVVTAMLLVSLDLWVVKSLGVSDRITGLYVAATMIPKALSMLSAGRMGMMTSLVSRAKATGDYMSTRGSILRIGSLFGSLIGACALFVYIFAESLIRFIFSDIYVEATPYLQVLIFSYAALAIAQMISCTLFALDNPWKLSLVWLGVSIVAVPTYALAGRLWGPMGIAYSVGLLSFVVSACLLLMVRSALADFRVTSIRLTATDLV